MVSPRFIRELQDIDRARERASVPCARGESCDMGNARNARGAEGVTKDSRGLVVAGGELTGDNYV
jgi:hypothetical protein